jgi:hypothetical protein
MMLPPLPARKSYNDVPRDSLAYALFLNPLMEVDPIDNTAGEPPTLKTLTARLKHMPGKHDQSAHGKPGRVGSAFRGAYSAARAGGAGHVEARNQAKTAAEQVRQTMRDEKRADLIANPKPKRVMPARVTPPPTTPATPASLRDRSVDEIAAEFERLLDVQPTSTPALSAAVANAEQELNTISARLYSVFPIGRAEKWRLQKAYKQKQEESQQLKSDEFFESTQSYADGYMRFLTQMRHPSDPATITITHKGGTPREQERAEALISAVVAMVPMVRNAQGDALPDNITVTHSSVRGEYFPGRMRTSSRPGTIVHEALHSLQQNHKHTQMNIITENWAVSRIGSEKRRKLSVLDPTKGYDANEVGYKDKVDDPYTLKDYGIPSYGAKISFHEVLTMAFTVKADMPIRSRNDKDLLRVGIEAILGTKEN